MQRDALAGQAWERGQVPAPALGAFAALALFGTLPYAAHGDWTLGGEAGFRHDNNVGNAQSSPDIVEDSVISARLPIFQLFPLGESYSADDSRRPQRRIFPPIHRVEQCVHLTRRAGAEEEMGPRPFAPWARIGISVARSDYKDSYRNAWIYRATLASGQRIDERWNLWMEYAFERRAANAQAEEVPGLSGDAFSQNSHNVAVNLEYSLGERTFLALGLLGRHGDVESTTKIYYRHHYQSPPAPLPERSAFRTRKPMRYRLTGTTYGFKRLESIAAPTPHSLACFARIRAFGHARGRRKQLSEVRAGNHLGLPFLNEQNPRSRGVNSSYGGALPGLPSLHRVACAREGSSWKAQIAGCSGSLATPSGPQGCTARQTPRRMPSEIRSTNSSVPYVKASVHRDRRSRVPSSNDHIRHQVYSFSPAKKSRIAPAATPVRTPPSCSTNPELVVLDCNHS